MVIPYAPRAFQLEYHHGRTRESALVCHRRFGKTVMLVNEKIKTALTCPLPDARVAYIAPTYSQAKRIAWDYAKRFSAPIPGVKANEAELRIDYPNGSRLQLLGQDNPDSLRGSYFDDVACDEFQLWAPNVYPQIIRPALADRKGRATFTGTPAGTENPLYEVYERIRIAGGYARIHKASETGYVDAEELASAKLGMSAEQYEQEFECSWAASIIGSIYGRSITAMESEGRIREVPPDQAAPMDTAWDLGINDATAIWCFQIVRGQIRLIDYYEASGEALAHYVHKVDELARKHGLRLGEHYLPHDVRARELGTGVTRLEMLESMRLKVEVVPAIPVMDGIEATRLMLKTCVIDRERCAYGIKALSNYRREYHEQRRTFYDRPVHDWSSHCCDALRGLAVMRDRGQTAEWGGQLSQPSFSIA